MTTSNTTFTFPTIRSDDHKRVYFDHQQLMVMKRWLREEGTTFVEGQDSLYVLSSKFKYMNKAVCQVWENAKGERMLMTPGEIARVELERAFGRSPDISEKKRLDLLSDSAPRYWDGNVYDDCYMFYTDLSGAYWQCWRLLTMDCVYPRGMGASTMFEMGERLKDNKPARNAVAGITRAHVAHMFYKGAFVDKFFYNPWFNPAIWAHLQSFVHEVATKAIAFGAVYVATDGYLFVDGIQWGKFNKWLEENDLDHKTLDGEGYCTAWTSYKVGEKQTKRKKYTSVLNHFNIVPHSGMVKWMQKRKRILLGQ